MKNEKRICPYCGFEEVVGHPDQTITCARCLKRYGVRLYREKDVFFEQEIWIPIKGYESLYEISNYMRIRSISHYTRGRHVYGRVITAYRKNNAMYVSLYKDGKNKEYNVRSLYRESKEVVTSESKGVNLDVS